MNIASVALNSKPPASWKFISQLCIWGAGKITSAHHALPPRPATPCQAPQVDRTRRLILVAVVTAIGEVSSSTAQQQLNPAIASPHARASNPEIIDYLRRRAKARFCADENFAKRAFSDCVGRALG